MALAEASRSRRRSPEPTRSVRARCKFSFCAIKSQAASGGSGSFSPALPSRGAEWRSGRCNHGAASQLMQSDVCYPCTQEGSAATMPKPSRPCSTAPCRCCLCSCEPTGGVGASQEDAGCQRDGRGAGAAHPCWPLASPGLAPRAGTPTRCPHFGAELSPELRMTLSLVVGTPTAPQAVGSQPQALPLPCTLPSLPGSSQADEFCRTPQKTLFLKKMRAGAYQRGAVGLIVLRTKVLGETKALSERTSVRVPIVGRGS